MLFRSLVTEMSVESNPVTDSENVAVTVNAAFVGVFGVLSDTVGAILS